MVLAIIGNVQLPPNSNSHLPTQVIVDDELEDNEPQSSNEQLLNVKTEPLDFLPIINGHSFASLFDSHSNTTQSESTDEQPIVIENDNINLSTRRPLFEDDEEVIVNLNNNHNQAIVTTTAVKGVIF